MTTNFSMPPPRDFSEPTVRRAWIKELLAPMDEGMWNDRVRELFAWQFARVSAFRRLCEGHGVTLKTLKSWREIPGVPQQLFKRETLFAYEKDTAHTIYETSGTTTGEPGRQHLLHTDVYEAICVEGARRVSLFEGSLDFYFLTASPREASHSSLSAMFGFWRKAAQQRSAKFLMKDGALDFSELRERLRRRIATRKPVALCGTAFSFVYLLDAWQDLPGLRLPSGSWILETGGFKGRTREIPKAELYAEITNSFGVCDASIWNEYGMSELSSQAYASGTQGAHTTPPWARVLIINPATGREVRVGQEGLVRWLDLANIDSVMSLQTLDRAVRLPQGFRIMGRLPRTEPRGCSLGAADMLRSSR